MAAQVRELEVSEKIYELQGVRYKASSQTLEALFALRRETQEKKKKKLPTVIGLLSGREVDLCP